MIIGCQVEAETFTRHGTGGIRLSRVAGVRRFRMADFCFLIPRDPLHNAQIWYKGMSGYPLTGLRQYSIASPPGGINSHPVPDCPASNRPLTATTNISMGRGISRSLRWPNKGYLGLGLGWAGRGQVMV